MNLHLSNDGAFQYNSDGQCTTMIISPSNHKYSNLIRSNTKQIHTLLKLLYISCFILISAHMLVTTKHVMVMFVSSNHANNPYFYTLAIKDEFASVEQRALLTEQQKYENNDPVQETKSYISLQDNFLPDQTTLVIHPQPPRPYPRWGETIEDEQQNGIDVLALMDFIVNSSVAMYITQQSITPLKDTRYVSTTDHQDDVGAWLPESLYVVDQNGVLYNSLRHRTCLAYGKGNIADKVIPIERSILSAIEYLKQSNTNTSCSRWPNLCHTILSNDIQATKVSTDTINDNDDPYEPKANTIGFPFLIFHGDFTGCNYHNYKKNKYSIPIFTTAAHVQCNHAFPFVTHEMLDAIKTQPNEWDDFFQQSHNDYPWSTKIPQVIWRGALTGKFVNDTFKNTRWNILRTIHTKKLDHVQRGHDIDSFPFNVGPVRLPIRSNTKHWINDLKTEVGGFTNRIDPMDDFQKYRAILDMDGNSWSSRFNLLLCYNSVIIKVEPTWVDYLQFNQRNVLTSDGKEDDILVLQPWKHYIPVNADLSDLFEIASFVNDPKNDDMLQEIVHNANHWCRNNLIKNSIDVDVLNILERYVQLLNINNPNWRSQLWERAKESIFHIDSPFRMKSIGWDEDEDYGREETIQLKKLFYGQRYVEGM